MGLPAIRAAVARSEEGPRRDTPERESHPREEPYLTGCQHDETAERLLLAASTGVENFAEKLREDAAHCRERREHK
jgi:hypothetical protein